MLCGGQATAAVNTPPITKGASESRTPLIIAPDDTPQLTLGAHKQPVRGDPLNIVQLDFKSPPRQRGGASESRAPFIIAPDDTPQLMLGAHKQPVRGDPLNIVQLDFKSPPR